MLTEELVTLTSELDNYVAKMTDRLVNYYKYALAECSSVNKQLLKEAVLYKHNLKYWNQYLNGTPVEGNNFITIEEFTIMVNRIKFIVRT